MHLSLLSTAVKPVLSNHSKMDNTKVLMANCSLMKVESIAECSLGAFCNTFDLHKAIIIPAFFFRKKGYINFVSKSVRRPSVRAYVRLSRFL